MKNVLYYLPPLLALVLTDAWAEPQITSSPSAAVCQTIEIYSKKGCPYCAQAYEFLGHLQRDNEHILVIPRDIDASKDNLERFIELNTEHNIDRPGVPSFDICGRFLVGFDPEYTGALIKQYLGLPGGPAETDQTDTITWIDIPFFGEISHQTLGMLGFTILVGLVDGFNPCAMWVLLFLLSLLVNIKDRKRILLIAGTFVLVSGAVYFAFMAAWLNLFLFLGFSRALQIAIACLAILIGTVHIKDFFAFKRGVSLSIPESAKPGLYARLRRVIQADNLIAALLAVFVVAVLVNFLELLCTAGLPAIYTQILTSLELNNWQYYGYLLLYNLAYIFDDALMVGIAVYTLNRLKIQERQGRWLKLISGLIIFALGALMLLAPEWLI